MVSPTGRLKLMLFSTAEAFAVPILMLIATPILLSTIGEVRFGVWAWINAVAAFCGLLNLNAAESIQTLAPKNENASALFFGNLALACVLTFSALLLGGLLLLVFGSSSALAGLALGELILPVLGAILFYSLRFVENTILAMFKANLNFLHSSLYSFSSKVMGFGLQIYLIVRGYEFYIAYCAGATITLLFILIEFFHATTRYQLNPKSLKITSILNELKTQKSFFVHSWAQNSATIASTNLDKVLIGTVLSPVMLAYYSIASMIISQVHLLFSSAFQIIVPEFSSPKTSDKTKRKHYLEYILLLCAGFLGVVFTFYFNESWLIRWWLKESSAGVIELLPYFLIFELFFVLNVVPYYTLMAERKMDQVNRVLIPMFILLIGSAFSLKPETELQNFILLRAGIVLAGSFALHWMGARLVFKNS